MIRQLAVFFLLSTLNTVAFCENGMVKPQIHFIHLSKPVKAKVSQIKTLKGIGFPVKSSGIAVFIPGVGVYYETQQPIRQAVAYSEAGMVDFDNQGKPIQNKATDNVVDKMTSQLLVALMNQNLSQLQQWFDFESKKTGNLEVIRLMPKVHFLKKAIDHIEMKQSDYLKSVRIVTKQGDETLLNFSNYTPISSNALIGFCSKFPGEKKGICHKKGQ